MIAVRYVRKADKRDLGSLQNGGVSQVFEDE